MYMSGTKHLCRYRDIGTSSLPLLRLFDVMKLMLKSDEVVENNRFRNNCILLIRGDATGTAGTATAVPNISQISSGLERVFYFVGHANNFVGFQSYIFCLNSSSDKEYGLETRRDYSRDRRARYYY